jgi:hypothetical protein
MKLMKYPGMWKNISDERIKDMKVSIKKLKKKSTEELQRNFCIS